MIAPNVYDELIKFKDGPVHSPEGPSPMVEYLQEQKYISVTKKDMFSNFEVRAVTWVITGRGESALSEFEDVRKKEAEQKEQQRFQNKVSVASILIPLITFVLGIVVEHFIGIIGVLFGPK